MYDMVWRGDKLVFEHGKNMTQHAGYDNQPFFHPRKPWLYYVAADSTGRTDIWAYHTKRHTRRAITRTHEREYSPTVTPDLSGLSYILQRDNGAQDLVYYPLRGGSARILLHQHVVGYHAWASSREVLLFVLPRPFKLHLVDVGGHQDVVVTDSIGRSLHKIPHDNAMSFVRRDTVWRLDLSTRAVTPISVALPGGDQDMAWTPDGRLLMSHQGDVYWCDPRRGSAWTVVTWDVPPAGKVSRIAVHRSNRRVALVVAE